MSILNIAPQTLVPLLRTPKPKTNGLNLLIDVGEDHCAVNSLRKIAGRKTVKDIRDFWEELDDDISWLKPHVSRLTREDLELKKNTVCKVDEANPIWLEAPLRRLKMQMQQIEPAIQFNPPQGIDPLAAEELTFLDICDTLVLWDDSKLRDTEQFIITLQQVLKHSSGVQPSTEYGGLSLLIHVMQKTSVKSPEEMLDCWAFATFEFSELVEQLSPLCRFMGEMRKPQFSRFLKTMLIFLQDLFPDKPVEGFNLYLLGELQGPLLREMDAKFRKYDPEGDILKYLARTLRPIASGALGLVECGVADNNITEISARLSKCRELAEDPNTSSPARQKLINFLEGAEKIAEEKVFSLKMKELAPYLGFSKKSTFVSAVAAPVTGIAVSGVPLPPVAPTGGPPPAAPPLPPNGLIASLASDGVQPLLFPKLYFEPIRFFKSINLMCTRVSLYLKALTPPKGEFQPWRLVNYTLPEATQGLWKAIREEHLRNLDNDIKSVLNEIKGTAGLQDEDQKIMTLVYMIKDLDSTPCGGEKETTKNVSRLRWLTDNIYVLYAHLHKNPTDDKNLVNSLTKYITSIRLDARKRLAVWETMLQFNSKFSQKSQSTTDVADQLRHLVTEDKVRQLILATLMHSRKIDGDIADKHRLDACYAVAKHFALVRTMVDNLCKNYKGIMILDHVRDLLPLMIGVEKKLKDVESGLANELKIVMAELESDAHQELQNKIQNVSDDVRVNNDLVVQFTATGSDEIFTLTKEKIPEKSLLYNLVNEDCELPVCKDDSGRILIEEIDSSAMKQIVNFIEFGTVPCSLSTDDWNNLKIATNYLGLDGLMSLILNGDLIYFDKLKSFYLQANRNINSISPIAEDSRDTLQVLTVLFKRITLIYEHIDTRSITNMFS